MFIFNLFKKEYCYVYSDLYIFVGIETSMFFIPIKFIKRKKKCCLIIWKKSLFYHFWLITKHKISSSKTSQTNMMNLDSIKEYFPFIFYISNLSLAGTKKRFIRKTRKSIYPIDLIFFIFILKVFHHFIVENLRIFAYWICISSYFPSENLFTLSVM